MRHTHSITKTDIRETCIIYGTSMYGEIAYNVLTQVWGVSDEKILFMDGNYENCAFSEKEIIKPDKICKYKDVPVLVCAAQSFDNIVVYLKNSGCTCIYDISVILEEAKKRPEIFHRSKYLYGDADIIEMIRRYCYYAGYNNDYNKELHLPYCVLCITDKCTLNCDKCAAFIPDYENKRDYSLSYVQNVFGKFLKCIDGIQELELMGGEPFLNKDFSKILEWYCGQEKIRCIKIVTNATFLPNAECLNAIKTNHKVKLILDNYGSYSLKLSEWRKWCEINNVTYSVQEWTRWYDIEPIYQRNDSEDELKRIFRSCIFRTCVGMTNGKLFRCNVCGHLDELKKVPDLVGEYIDIQNYKGTLDSLKYKIDSYMKKDYLKYCDWCHLYEQKTVKVAEQRKKK